MLNNIVARFIGPFLSQYCKEINSNQIEIQLRNGKAQLKDLVFQEDCFIQHHIPLYIKRGLINSLTLTISSDQCNIFIENLVLIGSEVFGSTLITENQFIETFTKKTFLKQVLKSIISIFFDPSFENLKKLFDNLTISIQKVHIRIEGLMTNKSLGIMLSSINFYSINEQNQKILVTNHPTTFSKKIDVKNFSIYFDTENKYPINKYSDSFESQMIMQIVNENEFILNPINFECTFKYNTEFNSIYDLRLNLGDLKLTFNNLQYEAFQNLINNIQTQRLYNFLDRPFKSIKSERSSTLWWCYSYRCIRYKKTSFQQLNISLALDVLKKRKNFYRLWKDYALNPGRHQKEYNEFMNTLNPNTLALLRYYSSFLFSKDANNHSRLLTEDDIARYFEKDKEILPSEFNISINSIQLDLNLKNKNNENENEYILTPLLGLNIDNASLIISKSKDDTTLKIETHSIFVNNYLNLKYREVLQIKDGIKGLINLNFYENYQATQFDIHSILAVFDSKLVSEFFKYFFNSNFVRNPNRISLKDKQINYLIDSHFKTKLDLKAESFNLKIPYEEIEDETPIIEIKTDLIECHSKSPSRYNVNIIESLYDKYEISLNSVQFWLNKTEITNKININSSINVSILSFNEIDQIIFDNSISPLEVNMTTFNSILITEFISFLSDEFTVHNELDNLLNLALPEFKVNFQIPSISIFFSYREENSVLYNTEAFRIEMDDPTEINISRKNKETNFVLLNKSGLKAFEYFSSKKGDFFFSTKFELKITFSEKKDVYVNFGDIEVYAKAIPVNFIQVFAESPKEYEWKLHFKDEPTITKFLHKKDQKIHQKYGFDMNIEFFKTRIYFIEFDTGENKEEREFFTVIIKHILVSIQHNEIFTTARIESEPPLATTTQFGQLWENMINEGETSSKPIIVNITPTSLSIDLDFFQVSLSPVLLLKIIKFSLTEKNPYSHLKGDPGTNKFMTFDLHVEKVLVKIIYDTDVLNYYELVITHSKYVTLKGPFLHQIGIKSLELFQRFQNRKDSLLFQLKNVEAELDMKLLLRDNVNETKAETFKSLLDKKGIEKWTEETIQFIENNQNEKILSRIFFYFYKLSINCRIDYLFCLYSHDFARNISYLVSCLLDNVKRDKFVEFIKQIDEPLDFGIDLTLPKGEFIIIDQTENKIANLTIDSIICQVNPNPFLFNAKLNSIILIDDQNDQILRTNELNVKTIEDEIYIILEEFELNLKLKYLPDSIYYIMNCPLFSFVDEFNNNKELTATSFEMINKNIFFSLSNFKITVPVVKNLFLFETALDVSLTTKGNIVQVRNIQMFLNQRLTMKKFSILFSKDIWDVEPISIYFSVFELHVIKMLIEEIKELNMPEIFVSKKEAELKRREFIIKLQQIDLIFTQPNLPFLTLEIKPSTFKQSYCEKNGGQQIIEYNVEVLLKHENHSNLGIDTIIDPFNVSVNSKIMNNQKFTYAHISPINIAISPYIISEIIEFKKRYSSHKSTGQIYQDKIIFFQNDTGVPIDLYLKNIELNEEVKFEINDNKPFQIDNFNYSTDLKIVFLYKTIFLSIKDLCYPIFFDSITIAYLIADFGVQTIHLSSPYVIKNQLPYDIEVFVNDYNIGVVKSNTKKPIPLVLVSSLANGIKAAISPITAAPSPPIKFKKPNAESKLYKFADEKNQRNLYSSVYFSTDSKRSICYISFLPYAIYMNQLPIPITVTLLNKYNLTYHIGTSQSVDVSFLKDKKGKLKIKVSLEPFGESEPTEVHTFGGLSTPSKVSIKRNGEEKCKIAVMTDYLKKFNTFQILIFCPCILYNKTGALLSTKDAKDIYYPFLNDLCFYTPDEYPKKVPLRVLIRDVTKLSNIDINCLDAKSIQTFPLPFINNENIYLILSATKIFIPFGTTTQLSLMVQFMVFNHLDFSIFLIPSNLTEDTKQFTNHCKANTKVPIVFTNLKAKFKLFVSGYKKCKEVNLINQTTTVFRLLSKEEDIPDLLIQLDVLKEENGFCSHFSLATFPSPIVITNMLEDQDISVIQKTSSDKKYPMIINSMTTTLFAKPQPFLEHESSDENSVIVCINNNDKPIEFTVSFSSDISPQFINDSDYYYEVRTTNSGDKIIIVGKSNSSNLSLINSSTSSSLIKVEKALFNVHFNKIEISFIDNYMHELFLIVIKNIILKLKKQKSITFTIDSLHINDMCIASRSPVVLCEKEPKFLTLKLKSKLPLKMHSFESLVITVAPIHLFIDIKFALDICFTISEFLDHFKINLSQKKEIDENKLKRFSFYSLKRLLISPLHIEFTLVKSKGRLNRVPYPKKKNFILFCLIKNIFVIPFETYKEFTSIEIQNIRAPINNFIKSLEVLYLNQITQEDIYNLIFRDSSLFNLSSTENFIDFIEDSFNDSHENKDVKIIAKPERIPRAFPLNRIISVSSDINNNNYCRYSLAQFTFQKTHPYESLLVMVDSKNPQNDNDEKILAIFDHYIVVLSTNLQEVKLSIKIPNFLFIDNQSNKLVLVIKNNQEIDFFCKDDHESRLIVTIIRSIADRMSLFGENNC